MRTSVCTSRRAGLRPAWGVPHNCRTSILQIISDTIPLYDTVCKRAILFVKKCLQCNSAVVKYVANYGVYHGRMKSFLGANVQVCCERFSARRDCLLGDINAGQVIDNVCKNRFTSEYYRRALAALELLMIRRGVLDISGYHFERCDIDAMLNFVCTE